MFKLKKQNLSSLFTAFSFLLLSACGGGGDDGETTPPVVIDTTPPVITITGDNPITIDFNSVYSDAGATASDETDGDLTSSIIVESNVDTSSVGNYIVSYSVSDAAGNSSSTDRSVEVVDANAPEISIIGNNPESVELASSYSDAGATALDDVDGDITANILTTNNVDTAVLGIYSVTYQVSDTAGNETSATREVEVFNDLPVSLNQAAFNGADYQYGYNSIENIPLVGAPEDTDRSRFAMLHDGITFRIYFFKKGANDRIYQFGFNSATGNYEFGFDSIAELTITGMPSDADSSTFAMLHDGATFRLYMKGTSNPSLLYQAAWNGSEYEYGFDSIEMIDITGAPADSDWNRWAMLHDGTDFRFYVFQNGSSTNFYQFAFNSASQDYEYGHLSIANLSVIEMPANSDSSNFAMLHDLSNYRFYFQTQ